MKIPHRDTYHTVQPPPPPRVVALRLKHQSMGLPTLMPTYTVHMFVHGISIYERLMAAAAVALQHRDCCSVPGMVLGIRVILTKEPFPQSQASLRLAQARVTPSMLPCHIHTHAAHGDSASSTPLMSDFRCLHINANHYDQLCLSTHTLPSICMVSVTHLCTGLLNRNKTLCQCTWHTNRSIKSPDQLCQWPNKSCP